MDASDRSLQIELSVDVLRELNHSVVQVTDGKEAKEKIAVLINELVNIVEGKVAEFNITDAIPAFITNVEGRWRTSEIAE